MNENNSAEDDGGYETLLRLEDLESLQEELEELGITGLEPAGKIPTDLRERMVAADVKNITQIRDKIMDLHAQIDEDESDLSITDS